MSREVVTVEISRLYSSSSGEPLYLRPPHLGSVSPGFALKPSLGFFSVGLLFVPCWRSSIAAFVSSNHGKDMANKRRIRYDAVSWPAEPEGNPFNESELNELRNNLARLSGPSVMDFYQAAYRECAVEKKPDAKAIQRLVTAWKILRRWDWR